MNFLLVMTLMAIQLIITGIRVRRICFDFCFQRSFIPFINKAPWVTIGNILTTAINKYEIQSEFIKTDVSDH